MQWCRKEIDAVAGQVRNPNLGVVLYLSYRMQHGMQHVATLSAPHEVSSLSRCRYLPRSFVVQMSGLRSSMTALQGDIAAQALHSRHVSQRSDEAYEQVHPLSLSASPVYTQPLSPGIGLRPVYQRWSCCSALSFLHLK